MNSEKYSISCVLYSKYTRPQPLENFFFAPGVESMNWVPREILLMAAEYQKKHLVQFSKVSALVYLLQKGTIEA
jgi:hypothetical protein